MQICHTIDVASAEVIWKSSSMKLVWPGPTNDVFIRGWEFCLFQLFGDPMAPCWKARIGRASPSNFHLGHLQLFKRLSPEYTWLHGFHQSTLKLAPRNLGSNLESGGGSGPSNKQTILHHFWLLRLPEEKGTFKEALSPFRKALCLVLPFPTFYSPGIVNRPWTYDF